MSLLGLDVGTTGTKAIVFSEDGVILGSAYRDYPLIHPRPGWSELDPEVVWNAVRDSIREAVTGQPVRALAISAQGEAVMPVGRDYRPLCNSPVSFCSRSADQLDFWHGRLSDEELYEITGHRISPIYTITKILWFREHASDAFSAAHKFLCYGDYVASRMGVEPAIDFSMAGRTFCFDIRKKEWSSEILEGTGVSPERLPRPVQTGTILGEVSSAMAEELGLPKGVQIVAGAHDQTAGALGAGVTGPGMAVDSIGTVECFTAAFSQPVLNDKMFAAGFPCYAHAVPGHFVSLAWNFSAGSILRWYRDTFSPAAEFEQMFTNLPEGPVGPMLLPYFTGAATPYFDSEVKGALVGLTLSTTREQIEKAILDGLSYEMRMLLDRWADAGVIVDRVRAVGGGAKNSVWLQQKADIYARTIASLNVSEAACLGMAIVAGVAIGACSSVDEAVTALVREERVYEPRPEMVVRYAETYGRYLQMYPLMRDFLGSL